jgi:hypothetical protein
MIGNYFAEDKDILLPVAVFITDGGLRADGTWEASEFRHATGDVYRAKMKTFNPVNGHLKCEITQKFAV